MPLYAYSKSRLVSGWKDMGVAVLVALAMALVAGALLRAVGMGPAMGLTLLVLSGIATEVVGRHYRWAVSSTVALAFFATSLVSVAGDPQHMGSGVRLITNLALAVALWLFWLRAWVPLAVALAANALMLTGDTLLGMGGFHAPWEIRVYYGLFGAILVGVAFLLDASDRDRQAIRSDVAFWLHGLGAWNLLWPVFVGLGYMHQIPGPALHQVVLEPDHPVAALEACALYVLVFGVALVLNRWALILWGSLLVFPAVAILALPEAYLYHSLIPVAGVVCVVVGLVLLRWNALRASLVPVLPKGVQDLVPPV